MYTRAPEVGVLLDRQSQTKRSDEEVRGERCGLGPARAWGAFRAAPAGKRLGPACVAACSLRRWRRGPVRPPSDLPAASAQSTHRVGDAVKHAEEQVSGVFALRSTDPHGHIGCRLRTLLCAQVGHLAHQAVDGAHRAADRAAAQGGRAAGEILRCVRQSYRSLLARHGD